MSVIHFNCWFNSLVKSRGSEPEVAVSWKRSEKGIMVLDIVEEQMRDEVPLRPTIQSHGIAE